MDSIYTQMTQMLKTLVGEVFFYVAIFGFSDLIVNYFREFSILCCILFNDTLHINTFA